jgi:hypothetical protein
MNVHPELSSRAWYRDGSPLVKLLAYELWSARFDDADEDGWLHCSDSNASVNVPELAAKIEVLRSPATGPGMSPFDPLNR